MLSEVQEREAIDTAAYRMYESKQGGRSVSETEWRGLDSDLKAAYVADAERAFDVFRPLLLETALSEQGEAGK